MPENWDPGIAYSSLSDVGMRRANNQDSMVCEPATNEERFRSHGHLFVVADGMGAHAAGELASELATQNIADAYFRCVDESAGEALQKSLLQANREIFRRGQSNPEFYSMGTTASSLALTPEGAVIGHVGDSRVYRLRDGLLEQMTFDHSLVWEMQASAELSGTRVGEGIPKNVITRSLGPHESVEVDVEGPFPIEQGDRFLLCSDGLTGMVEDSEIAVLLDCLSEDVTTRVLVDLANLRGGPDNITVIVVRVEGGPDPEQSERPRPRPVSDPTSPLLFLTTAACFAGAGLLATLRLANVIRSWGPVIVAIILAMIAATTTAVSLWRKRQSRPPSHPATGGAAPYRRFDAQADETLYARLGETVSALREAADEKNWLIDWRKVDQLQQLGQREIDAQNPRAAIRHQSEAIVETMNQLRQQHDRAASETQAEQ